MNELFESFDKNKLYFEYVGPSTYVSFQEYYDSKEVLTKQKIIDLIIDLMEH